MINILFLKLIKFIFKVEPVLAVLKDKNTEKIILKRALFLNKKEVEEVLKKQNESPIEATLTYNFIFNVT